MMPIFSMISMAGIGPQPLVSMMAMGLMALTMDDSSPYLAIISSSSCRVFSAIQSSGASEGTETTSPVPTFGSQNVAGSAGISRCVMGVVQFIPTRSVPAILPMTSTSSIWYFIFSAAGALTTQISPACLTLTYSTSGFTQKLVWPKTVSGRNVAATRNMSPTRNFISVYSVVSAPPPHMMSVSEASIATGPQLTQAGAK